MKRSVGLLAATALSLSMLAGCGGPANSGGAGNAVTGDTIKIGLNYELSGEAASYGQSSVAGIKAAAEEINAAGGVNGKKIEFVEYDNKSDTAEATTLATKLMSQDKVVAEIGPATSGGMKAVTQVAAKNSVPVVSGSSTADDLTIANGKLNEYIFRTCFNDSFQGTKGAEFAAKKLNAKTAVVLKDTSNDYSKGLADNFVKTFEAGGGKVAATEAYTKGQTDFNAVLTKLKGQTFDAVYLPGYYNEVGLIIAQARKLGITQPIIGGDGYDSPKLAELAGTGLTDVYFTNHYSSMDPDPKVASFIDAWKKKNNAEPNAFNALGYDTMQFVAASVKNAGDKPTGATIKDAMQNFKGFQGVTGSFDMDPATHNPIKSVVVMGYKDGKITSSEKA